MGLEKPVFPLMNSTLLGLLELELFLFLSVMRNRIFEIRWFATYNVGYWNRVESLLHKWDVIRKILLGLGAVVSLFALAYDPDYAVAVAILSSVCAILSTVFIPALGWDTLVERVASIRMKWVDIARQSKALWEDHEAGVKISDKRISALEGSMYETEKEVFWLWTIEKYREEATEEAKTILSC